MSLPREEAARRRQAGLSRRLQRACELPGSDCRDGRARSRGRRRGPSRRSARLSWLQGAPRWTVMAKWKREIWKEEKGINKEINGFINSERAVEMEG